MLPDEIILEILSPALKVPDKAFSDSSSISPFATYCASSSVFLLVCKDWLRVATPLLYKVVVLRSKAQANVLEEVLRVNPQLGQFIKKLRVEGGYGAAMQTILEAAASSLQDIFLSLAIRSSDSTVGLCKGLPRINPKRVIISDPRTQNPLKNKNLDSLLKAIYCGLQTWDIQTINLPYGQEDGASSVRANRVEGFVKVIAQSTSIHTIQLSALLEDAPHFVRRLTKLPSLETIDFTANLNDGVKSLIDAVPELKALAHLEDQSVPAKFDVEAAASLNPNFVPLSSALEATRNAIWCRIFFFVLDVEERRNPSFDNRFTRKKKPSRVPILCVSKLFNQLALPYVYDSLRLCSSSRTQLVVDQLQQRKYLGSWIHSIFVSGYLGDSAHMIAILSQATNLRFFDYGAFNPAYALPMNAFNLLAKMAGASLIGLEAKLDFSFSSPDIFKAFSQLHILAIHIDNPEYRFPTIATSSMDTALTPSHDLLHTLHIIGWAMFSLNVFKYSSLASLHTLILPLIFHEHCMDPFIAFMRIHGARLRHLVVPSDMERCESMPTPMLELCPNLIDLRFHEDYSIAHTTIKTPHASLIKIIAATLPPKTSRLNVEMFPSLQQIELKRFGWPTNEYDIKNCGSVAIAEALLAERGIKVIDSAGKDWVPRLKKKRARKP
ncbi:F-box domain-containing protein [Favolaschia claudopus]|uniref:F-box domain-containing protein n=1 Tax=Favolaschia claudopus TaxID=2862362 RepID=A0AAW0DD80_9AGAR